MHETWIAVGDRTATQAATRYGCFLPDLTGLARGLPAAGLPPHYISCRRVPGKLRLGSAYFGQAMSISREPDRRQGRPRRFCPTADRKEKTDVRLHPAAAPARRPAAGAP